MKKQHWLYQNNFKQYLETNKTTELHFIVEEYERKKFRIQQYPNEKSLINDLVSRNKCYYNIFYQPSRHLYLDFDYYLEKDLQKNEIYLIAKEIIRLLTNFYNIHKSVSTYRKKPLHLKDFYVFDSSRHIQHKQFNFKLSLHIYNYRIIYEDITSINCHITTLQQFIMEIVEDFRSSSNIFNLALNAFQHIDHSIYKSIQYLRAYNCCKFNEPNSKKKILYPKTEISINEIMKITNVDKNDLSDICVHFKSLTTNNNFNTIQEQHITRFTINDKKLSTFSSSSSSSSSMNNLYLYEYVMSANNNELEWKENRTYQNNKIISITYNCINLDIKYPRLFLNLTNFPLHEIKTLNLKLTNSNIKIKDTFKILFTNWEKGKSPDIEYIVYFNKNNVTLHNHIPLFIKKHSKKIINKDKKSFSIYCKTCHKFFDL